MANKSRLRSACPVCMAIAVPGAWSRMQADVESPMGRRGAALQVLVRHGVPRAETRAQRLSFRSGLRGPTRWSVCSRISPHVSQCPPTFALAACAVVTKSSCASPSSLRTPEFPDARQRIRTSDLRLRRATEHGAMSIISSRCRRATGLVHDPAPPCFTVQFDESSRIVTDV